VEPELLQQAFPLAAAGTLAEQAELKIENQAVRVHCPKCNGENEVPSNRLVCPECEETHTRLVSGDELLLARLELIRD
jgi:hydrogenase nickel incorporation protein HypA/HybF